MLIIGVSSQQQLDFCLSHLQSVHKTLSMFGLCQSCHLTDHGYVKLLTRPYEKAEFRMVIHTVKEQQKGRVC